MLLVSESSSEKM